MVHHGTKVFERRRAVTSMLVRGATPSEIAEALQVKRETVYNDIRVIRTGKNESLFSHTRKEIIAQLFLNARERMRYLWKTAEETEKDYVKIRAMMELRLNDERIFARLSDPKVNPDFTPKYSEQDVEYWVEQYDELLQRVEQMKQRREKMISNSENDNSNPAREQELEKEIYKLKNEREVYRKAYLRAQRKLTAVAGEAAEAGEADEEPETA